MQGQLTKFLVVGLGATAIQYIILILLVHGIGFDSVTGSAIGFAISSIFNYFWNRNYTFCSTREHSSSFPRFLFVSVTGLSINTLLMWGAVIVLEWHYFLGQLLATGGAVLWNYQLNRLWTFNS